MNGIGVREAARKYAVPQATVQHWSKRGLIRIVRHAEKRGQAVLLYEPDIAALAAAYSPGRGRWGKPTLETLLT